KALLAGAVLQSLPEKDLNRTISYSQKDLVSYSPETQKYVGKGMTIAQLCEAAVRFSDNSATNLLLKELGGVEQYQRILRQLGDNVTHTNRLEPDLNQAKPNDIRDTSTPKQMAMNLNAYLLGNTLTESQKTILWNWLDNNATGNPLIRAATPTSWKVYDKS
ncbi:serine hydrolase, partial [Glaesserella parasuis]|nr:serine hydrolase [Glaesserella parasuis]